MRQLVYDCYVKGMKVATVGTYAEAQAWLAKDKWHNRIKECVVEIKTKETDKERDERLSRINKRNEARAKKLKDAAVG